MKIRDSFYQYLAVSEMIQDTNTVTMHH